MDPRTLTTHQEGKPKTAQQQLLDIWLSLPKGEVREAFFFGHLVSPDAPEVSLAKWQAKAQGVGSV